MSQGFHRQSAELNEVLQTIEKEDPTLNETWKKNTLESEKRDRETSSNSKAYASKLEAGIRSGAVALAMTAKTRSEAVDLARGALSASDELFFYDIKGHNASLNAAQTAVAREEFFGSALLDLYKKTRERMPGPNPENGEKIAKRMEQVAGILTEAYNSPTASEAFCEKIDAMVDQEKKDTTRGQISVDGSIPIKLRPGQSARPYLSTALRDFGMTGQEETQVGEPIVPDWGRGAGSPPMTVDESARAIPGASRSHSTPSLQKVSASIDKLRSSGTKADVGEGGLSENSHNSIPKIGKTGLRMGRWRREGARANALADESVKMTAHDR